MNELRYVLTIYGIDIELPDADTALELSMEMRRFMDQTSPHRAGATPHCLCSRCTRISAFDAAVRGERKE